jgi:hypothetical protein
MGKPDKKKTDDKPETPVVTTEQPKPETYAPAKFPMKASTNQNHEESN